MVFKGWVDLMRTGHKSSQRRRPDTKQTAESTTQARFLGKLTGLVSMMENAYHFSNIDMKKSRATNSHKKTMRTLMEINIPL